MRRFKKLTVGKPVVMGRRTAVGLGAPLVDRTNIVVSSHATTMPGFIGVTSLAEALVVARDALAEIGGDEIMVIGGGELYRTAIAAGDRLYLTHVDIATDGDTQFPDVDWTEWRETSRQAVPAGDRDSHASEFVTYDRIRPASA